MALRPARPTRATRDAPHCFLSACHCCDAPHCLDAVSESSSPRACSLCAPTRPPLRCAGSTRCGRTSRERHARHSDRPRRPQRQAHQPQRHTRCHCTSPRPVPRRLRAADRQPLAVMPQRRSPALPARTQRAARPRCGPQPAASTSVPLAQRVRRHPEAGPACARPRTRAGG